MSLNEDKKYAEDFTIQFCNMHVGKLLQEIRNNLFVIISKSMITLNWTDLGYLMDTGTKALEALISQTVLRQYPHLPHEIKSNLMSASVSSSSSRVMYHLLELNTLKLNLPKRPAPSEIVHALFGEIHSCGNEQVQPFISQFSEILLLVGRTIHDTLAIPRRLLTEVTKSSGGVVAPPPQPGSTIQPPPPLPPRPTMSAPPNPRTGRPMQEEGSSNSNRRRRRGKSRNGDDDRYPGKSNLPTFNPPRNLTEHNFPVVVEVVKQEGNELTLSALDGILQSIGLIPRRLEDLILDRGAHLFELFTAKSGARVVRLRDSIVRVSGTKRGRSGRNREKNNDNDPYDYDSAESRREIKRRKYENDRRR